MAALGVTGSVLLAPLAVVGALLAPPVAAGALTAVGFTSAGIAAGNLILFPLKEIRY